MDPLFSDFDNGMSPENTKDFEEMMTNALELGNLSAQTMSSTLRLPDLNECRDNGSVQHATTMEKFEVSPYFPPPSPVSPDASFLALNFDSKGGTEESVNVEEQFREDIPHKRTIYPVQSNPQDHVSQSHGIIRMDDYAEARSHPKRDGPREPQESNDAKNRTTFGEELTTYATEYVNRQTYSAPQTIAPVGSSASLFPEMSSHKKESTEQQVVPKRDILKYANPEHGLQALLQLLSESSHPPRKKPKTGRHFACVDEEPGFNGQTRKKLSQAPGVTDTIPREAFVRQSTVTVKPQASNDAWTDLLQIGSRDDIIYDQPVPGESLQSVPECSPVIFQPDAIPVTSEELKLRLSTPLDDSWFLCQNPTASANSRSIHRNEFSNNATLVASNEVIPKHTTDISDNCVQRCSDVPQPGSHIEILYPIALGNKSPEVVRTLLRATGDDIVSKIELYWSHFHDYRASAERAGRLLREKSVRFERRKRMGSEVSAIEKKAIRAQRNRERSQALRRYHKQRMGDLEVVSGQLKLYNSVAKSLINCLLEEPQSLELVQEYFSSHECSEELLTYLRDSP